MNHDVKFILSESSKLATPELITEQAGLKNASTKMYAGSRLEMFCPHRHTYIYAHHVRLEFTTWKQATCVHQTHLHAWRYSYVLWPRQMAIHKEGQELHVRAIFT
jgi:hypothetical protein